MALAFVGRPADGLPRRADHRPRRGGPAHALGRRSGHFHDDGGTVLLTSHYLEEVEALAQRVVVVGHGRVLADDTVRAVRDIVGVRRVCWSPTTCPNCPA